METKILSAFDIKARGVAVVFEAEGKDAQCRPVGGPTLGESAVIILDGERHDIVITGVGNQVINGMNEVLIRGDLTREQIAEAEVAILEYGLASE